jgi:hypothetical protein
MLRFLLLNPEKLSRLIFSLPDGKSYYVQATAQQKARRALPEEIVRQLFVLSLLHDYKYPEDRISIEWSIQMGREKKRADIVVLDENGKVFIIIEIKVETDKDSLGQLMSYMKMEGAKYGALISATEMECIEMQSASEVVKVRDIPLFDPSQNSPRQIQASHLSHADMTQVANENQEFPLEKQIGLEKFERVSETHANITIKGKAILLPFVEIDSYKKLRNRFMAMGVSINPDVKQPEWSALFHHLLDSNPMTEKLIDANRGSVEIEVMKMIDANHPGFAGGWICSLDLDAMLKLNRMDKTMPRTKRREMLQSLGYEWHPALQRISCHSSTPVTAPIAWV